MVKKTPLRFLKDGLATELLRETCKRGLILKYKYLVTLILIGKFRGGYLRPPRGVWKLIFTKLINIVPLEQCHHKPTGMYADGPFMFIQMSLTCILVVT